MADEKLRRQPGIPVLGILLLFVGVVVLLQNFNVLPAGLWETLWRFWPVLIIIVGLGIILRRYNVWLVSLLILAILGACLGIAIWRYEPPLPAGGANIVSSQPIPFSIRYDSSVAGAMLPCYYCYGAGRLNDERFFVGE